MKHTEKFLLILFFSLELLESDGKLIAGSKKFALFRELFGKAHRPFGESPPLEPKSRVRSNFM